MKKKFIRMHLIPAGEPQMAYNSTYGFWNIKKKWHINYKEFLAVKAALEYLAKDLRNCCILLRIDNTTAI